MRRFVAISIILLILYAVMGWCGIYFNFFSGSMPLGFYQKISSAPTEGAIAATCLTPQIVQEGLDRGYLSKGVCNTGIRPLIKHVLGRAGDIIAVKRGILTINGIAYPDYPVWNHDSQGRLLRRFYSDDGYTLKEGEYLLLSNYNEKSWDSRYYAGVPIEFVLKPLWIIYDHQHS